MHDTVSAAERLNEFAWWHEVLAHVLCRLLKWSLFMYIHWMNINTTCYANVATWMSSGAECAAGMQAGARYAAGFTKISRSTLRLDMGEMG